jgi:hypothetical protein
VSLLSTGADYYRRNPFFRYDPMCGMLPFHLSGSTRRFLRCPTQTGKTWAGIYEDWAHLVGVHRWREIEPSSGWVVLANLENHFAEFCDKLHQLEPRDLLDPATRYTPGKGYYTNGARMIRSKAGHTIKFRSGEGQMQALESGTIGWLHIDEVPKQPHFGAALSRIAVATGPAWMTFTPIGRPVKWLRTHVEGDPELGTAPREHWETFRSSLTPADCTTISGRCIRPAASIAAQVASYSAWEIRQRVYGEWEGTTEGRMVPAYSDEHVFDDSAAPTHIESLGFGWDHGQRVGAQVCYLVAYDGFRLWVLGEYVSNEHATPDEDMEGAWKLAERWGVTSPFAINEARGDSNSAGKLGLGMSVNETLERAFARKFGLDSAPFSIRVPYKGKGTVRARPRMVNAACASGRLRVHESCKHLDTSLRNWTGADDDLKHAWDAFGYIAEVYLDASRGTSASKLTIT